MPCPTCTTDVPAARFCARCGERLRTPSAPPPRADSRVTRGRGTIGALLVVVLAVAALGAARLGADRLAVDGAEVDVPTAVTEATSGVTEPVAAREPFEASPGATVLCSNFSEHRIEYTQLDGAEVGAVVEVHGGPCVVTQIDADAGPPDYPRGVARGNRPGTGPTPRR